MDHSRMLAVLSDLANGVDPATGSIFPADSPYQHPETVRALFLTLRWLESPTPEQTSTNAGTGTNIRASTRTATKASDSPVSGVGPYAPPSDTEPTVPVAGRKPSARSGNAGKAWTEEEDQRLAAGFDAGEGIEALTKTHGRSRLALEIRLAKLGRLPMPENARYGAGKPTADPGHAPRAASEPASARSCYAAAAAWRSNRAAEHGDRI